MGLEAGYCDLRTRGRNRAEWRWSMTFLSSVTYSFERRRASLGADAE
jgi:hypothetical protein